MALTTLILPRLIPVVAALTLSAATLSPPAAGPAAALAASLLTPLPALLALLALLHRTRIPLFTLVLRLGSPMVRMLRPTLRRRRLLRWLLRRLGRWWWRAGRFGRRLATRQFSRSGRGQGRAAGAKRTRRTEPAATTRTELVARLPGGKAHATWTRPHHRRPHPHARRPGRETARRARRIGRGFVRRRTLEYFGPRCFRSRRRGR
jgi:hypothetical protein